MSSLGTTHIYYSYPHRIYSEQSEVYTHTDRVCMALLHASKTSLLLATVSQAPLPAPLPAPRMSIKVSYLHKER